MKLPRATTLALIGVSTLLAACGGTAAPAPSQTASASASQAPAKKVGLALSTLNNPFFVSVQQGALGAAGAAGVQVLVADGQNDNAKQADEIATFIAQKVDVILVNPTDSDAVVPSVQKANQANIPVIALDRAANGGKLATTIASNNVQAGQLGAQQLIAAVQPGAKVAMLIGIPGASAANDRGKGFTDSLADSSVNTKGLELVAQQSANFDRTQGLNVMQNVLTANRDIAGVFAQNDEMALGAVQAIKAAGLSGRVAVVGVDGEADAVAAVKSGDMYATVAQQPAEMGKLAVQAAAQLIAGQTLQPKVDVPLQVITKANAG